MKENITISADNAHNLEIFTEILKKDPSAIINEALEIYFENAQKELLEKNLENENSMTNLNYDEFWGDLDI